ncbi:MAG: TetR/AcrR family transcriptional regulator [Chloroflexota bacterium]
MPRPSQKDKILDAALQCFARQGYPATRIRDIAERAETSEAALYRHYDSKEAVAQALFAQHLQDFSIRLKQVAVSPQSIEDKLRGVIRLCLTTYREKPAAFSFILLNTPSFMPQLPAGTVYPLDVIEQIMAAGQREGVVRRGQANLLAAIFLGCILRPIIVSQLADPGALDLLHDDRHDQVLVEATLAAVAHPL